MIVGGSRLHLTQRRAGNVGAVSLLISSRHWILSYLIVAKNYLARIDLPTTDNVAGTRNNEIRLRAPMLLFRALSLTLTDSFGGSDDCWACCYRSQNPQHHCLYASRAIAGALRASYTRQACLGNRQIRLGIKMEMTSPGQYGIRMKMKRQTPAAGSHPNF